MNPARLTYAAKAQLAWGNPPPDWIVALANEADRVGGRQVAKALGYSNATISYVLSNKYSGDVEGVAEKVRGVLLGAEVNCPVAGEITRHYCLEQQKRTDKLGFPRRQFFERCRGIGVPKCPNSRIPDGQR